MNLQWLNGMVSKSCKPKFVMVCSCCRHLLEAPDETVAKHCCNPACLSIFPSTVFCRIRPDQCPVAYCSEQCLQQHLEWHQQECAALSSRTAWVQELQMRFALFPAALGQVQRLSQADNCYTKDLKFYFRVCLLLFSLVVVAFFC
jgi:hypothetical protein